MRLFTTLAALSALPLVTACAQHPSEIAPISVSTSQYQGYSCAQINTELNRVNSELNSLIPIQAAEANSDTNGAAVGVLIPIVGVALAAGGPDHSGQIAQLRGESNTLQTLRSSCS